jgi:hypothetical protein
MEQVGAVSRGADEDEEAYAARRGDCFQEFGARHFRLSIAPSVYGDVTPSVYGAITGKVVAVLHAANLLLMQSLVDCISKAITKAVHSMLFLNPLDHADVDRWGRLAIERQGEASLSLPGIVCT